VTRPDSLIADALHDLAAEAATPRPMAATAWRTGRRRRHAAAGASAAGVAAVLAAAVLIPLTVAAGPASLRPGGTPPPFALATSISFRQVVRTGSAPCPAGSTGLPTGSDALPAGPPLCVYLTGPTVVITRVESLGLVAGPGVGCVNAVAFGVTPAEGRSLLLLTSRLQHQLGTMDQPGTMAIIVGGRVIAIPEVQSASSDSSEIEFPAGSTKACPAAHAKAEQLFRELRGS
jgi:hypothetical protein